ncbi:MAG: TldD/PmbA family protein [Ignavibacteria bacterium]|nr:TldD/PmbA family protein [Ignavibacteria bacterium]MCU7504044.1 TldD/PmbA family protein [Ignavibacteria bacterium]MCU7515416.1 TldD/PmbA family protein [Ignavibacteria bacterium]
MNHFGVDEKIINEVMSVALSKGGDYCDLYFQHSIDNYIGLEDKAVNRAYTDVGFGVGIRVLKGDQTGYSFTEEITPGAMKLAAQTAASIADSGALIKPQELKLKETPAFYPIETPWEEVGIDKKVPYLQQINEKVFAEDKRIIKSNIWFINGTSYIMVANSLGRIACDYQPMGQIAVSCTAEQNGQREQNYFDLSGRHGIEFFTPANIDKLAKESVRRTVMLFDAIKPEAGEMEVILAAGSSGILLHEAIGHGMEADFNRKNISIFSDKIDKPVAEKFVSIVDDGTNPNLRGSINVDDEGNDTEKTYLVENGTLKSYLHDYISSRFYKVKPTGNGRRESFRHVPQPRMRNTYMEAGPHKKDEIIASVKKGLYAEAFTNGEVFIGAGDFTFYVKSGYLIEDGKITKPVKDVNIIGNGPQVLKDIVMVGDDLQMSEGGWTCGKNGQGVPVSMGLPTVKVKKITVGGLNTAKS